jgi:hypothetical protein
MTQREIELTLAALAERVTKLEAAKVKAAKK